MKCLQCGEELDYEEVDVGVGILQGNYFCSKCGWSPSDEFKTE